MINDKRPADHFCEETCVSEPEVIDSPGNDVTTQVMFSSPLESPDHSAMPSFYTASKLKSHSLWRDLLPTVSASSEAVKPKFQSTDASVLGHFMSPQNSALSASSTVGSSIVPPSSSSSSSTQSTVSSSARTSSSGNEDHAAHKTDTSRVSHVPVQQPSIGSIRSFRPGIRREGEFVCGWGAAFINICVTFPINKAMFRQQLHGISGLRAFGQLRKDGLRYLYRGLLPPLMQKTSSLSIMFGMYYRCQDAIKEQAPDLNVYANHTLAALASGTIEAMFMPFERIQTLMQTRQYHNKFANTVDAFHGLKAYGIREYYRGFSLIILRNGPSNVAFFLGREYLQEKGPRCNTSGEKMLQDFICGACLGAIISTVFFPLNVVKTHMQCRLGGPFDGVWPTFKVVLQERNGSIRGLFRGIHLNYTRSFISWGIINASFDCPKSDGDDSRAPTRCLVCGRMLCSQSYCCQADLDGTQVGAATEHAYHCGANSGIFLRVRECQVLLLSNKIRGCFLPAPYLDMYGETDQGLRRGNPLTISLDNYQNIQKLWYQHTIPQTISRSLNGESGPSLMIEWHNL